MDAELSYGKTGFTLRLPPDSNATILRKPTMPLPADPDQEIARAIANPLGASCLSELALGCQSACIAICDITRPVPNNLFLRPLIDQLIAAGVPRSEIHVLIATGLHRPNLGQELEELVGDDWVLQNIGIFNHDAQNDAQHVSLGVTPTRSTVARIDQRFADADLRIATGLVEPHFMAGYSGGRKVIAPGLAHAETIRTFHSARFMADPATRNCNLQNNPLHEEQLEILKLLDDYTPHSSSSRVPVTLGLNTVIDEQRQLSLATFGEILQSHDAAVQFVRRYCEVEVDGLFDIVLTTAAGYPLDKTYYQTVKGMVGAMDILKPGGDMMVVSECSEGLGSSEYADAQRRLIQQGPTSFLDSLLLKTHADIDEWQTQMQLKPQSVGNVHLFSEGLSDSERSLTGVNCIQDVESELSGLLQRHSNARIAIIPEGPYVVPVLKQL